MALTKMTKLVATLGPSTDDQFTIKEMMENGVNVFRLNFSHGSHEDHKRRIENVRLASKETGITVALLQDLQGPKIRVGKIEGQGMMLQKGTSVVLTIEDPRGDEIPVQYKGLPGDVHPGDIVLLDDGLLELRVTAKTEKSITAKVIVGGLLKSNKGINLPTASISIPALSEKDREDLRFGLENKVDFVALSFVKTAEDIRELRSLMAEYGGRARVVAKIERHEAVANYVSIVKEADAVMVARGDLGVELGETRVPIIQKNIINECRDKDKPVIVATQMLESMIHKPRPTRAEASDVANAILDGADAVMLSAETASGEYPLEAIRTIHEIATDVESWIRQKEIVAGRTPFKDGQTVIEAIASTIVRLARRVDAKVILTATSTGNTATAISSRRPFVPVLAITHDASAMRYMAILWGVDPYVVDFTTVAEMVDNGLGLVKKEGYAGVGDLAIISSGKFPGVPGGTNIIEVKAVE